MRCPLRIDSRPECLSGPAGGRELVSSRPHSTVEARIKIRICELKILAYAAAYDARFPSQAWRLWEGQPLEQVVVLPLEKARLPWRPPTRRGSHLPTECDLSSVGKASRKP
jgi:hypothetical protein